MELYQLKTFVTVAGEGHLARAANRLHASQPSVSAHIKSLEDELGVALFTRGPKGMALTREGSILCKQAEEVLCLIDYSRNREEQKLLKVLVAGVRSIWLETE
ncbi:MAG: LysR family transcriptional regulator [Thermodesulfobacteriota bacterium]